MKLLILSGCLPGQESGASARNYHLLKALARQHTVSLLTLADRAEADDIALLEGLVASLRVVPLEIPSSKRWQQLRTSFMGHSYMLHLFQSKEVQTALDEMFAHDQYDAVFCESIFMAGYRFPPSAKVIIDQHNLEHELLQRTYKAEKSWLRKLYNWQEFHLVKRAEIARCRSADLVLVTSERERYLLKSLLPMKVVETVPNGVDTGAFNEVSTEQEVPNKVVFTGTMNYYPNIKGVLFFVEHCWPLIQAQVPGATFHIVGKHPPAVIQKLAELPDVVVTGKVPDIRSYLATAAVAIAPLQIGSGTRLKILEGLAMRKAMVSTTIGCEGLSVVSGEHLLVVDQSGEFAGAVVDLLKDSAKRRALGNAGRALVESEYSWEHCGSRLLQILDHNFKEGE